MATEPSPATRRACIVGAGISGLVSAKVLLADGFHVDLFEKQSDLGGTWHPDRTYPGLRTNDPGAVYSFSDLPYPDTADAFPTAEQVRKYLHDYAERFGLRPHMHFDTRVLSVEPAEKAADGSARRFHVTVWDGRESSRIRTYDYVIVCNGVFSEPHVPAFAGEERFDGPVLHSSQLRDRQRLVGRRVVVVGGGKSAYDCAETAGRDASQCTMVLRSPHWLAPRYVMGLRADWLILTRVAQALLPYHTKHGAAALLHGPGKPIVDLYWRFMTWFLTRAMDIPAALEPEVPLPVGLQDVGAGTELYDLVWAGRVEPKRAEIAEFVDGETVRLSTGETVPADVLICATGWVQSIDFLGPSLRDAVCDDDGFFTLYRHIVPPREPHLGFIGYASSIGTTMSSEVSAHWLSSHFLGRMEHPREDRMYEEIGKVKRWAEVYLPRESSGHAVAVYLVDFLDQLLRDMDVPVHRASNWFSEYFGRVHASRFRGLQEQRHRS